MMSTAPAPTAVAPELRFVGAGFGGVGPASPPGVPNAWVAVLVELASPTASLTGVRAAKVVLLGPSGTVIARAVGPIDMRTAPPGRKSYDFAEEGTTPFAGSVATGASILLRLHAPFDTRLEDLAGAGHPTKVRVELVGDGGLHVVVEGPAGQWGTG